MVYMKYMEIIWTPVKNGLLGKSKGGHYFIYKNFDPEARSSRWFGNYNKFGEHRGLIIFSGFDSLEDAQAFCEKNALDVERALHGGAEPPEAP